EPRYLFPQPSHPFESPLRLLRAQGERVGRLPLDYRSRGECRVEHSSREIPPLRLPSFVERTPSGMTKWDPLPEERFLDSGVRRNDEAPLNPRLIAHYAFGAVA